MKYNLESVQTKEEELLFFTDSEHDAEMGCIGPLRMGFGTNGSEFFSTWTDHANAEANDAYFKEVIDDFINDLRDNGVLTDRKQMRAYCRENDDCRNSHYSDEDCWGFRYIRDKYVFYLRCHPNAGDYDAYLYAYDRQELMNYLASQRGLPSHCYSSVPSTSEPILIRYAEKGYYPIDLRSDLSVDSLNNTLGVTPAQKLAMEIGSMYGWNVPGVNPKIYEKTGEKNLKENELAVRIYQVVLDRDSNNVAFQGYNTLERWQGSPDVDSGIYDKVFDGTVEAASLEKVYQIFNIDRPAGYKGRSLSVSDVIEVADSATVEKGFYYCDSFGFQKIDFDPESVGKENTQENMIRVLVVEPEKKPYEKMISSGLESLKHEVDGDIEAVYPFEEPVALVCDEEGKLNGKDLNRALRDDEGEMYDIIAGTFLVVGIGEDDFCSLDDENLAKFKDKFKNPEMFIRVNDKIHVVPIKEKQTRDMSEKNTHAKTDKGDR